MTNEYKRNLPINELDLRQQQTESKWGKPDIPKDLKEKLDLIISETSEATVKENLWDLFGYYTQDLRLSNLSYKNNEIQYCMYYLDLAGDFLKENMIKSFLVCLSRVATVTELAQSKGGFLRRQMNTLRTENVDEILEPKKKTIFGGGK